MREHKGKDRRTRKPHSTYQVRWVVVGRQFGKTFQTKALAESFRSRLIALAQADTILLWDPDNRTLIAANVVGTWLTTTGVTRAEVTVRP